MRVLSRLIPLCLSLSYLAKIGGCQDYKECTAILQPQANGDKTGWGVRVGRGVPPDILDVSSDIWNRVAHRTASVSQMGKSLLLNPDWGRHKES